MSRKLEQAANSFLSDRIQQFPKLSLEGLQSLQQLWGGFHNLLFGLEDLLSVLFGQHAHNLAHAPSGGADHAEAVGCGLEQGDAMVTDHAYGHMNEN